MDNKKLNRRDFIKAAGIGAAALALPAGAKAADVSCDKKEFCYFVMADPQLFWGSKESWEKAIGFANKLKPDFVVVCGDLVNNTGDEKEAKAYLEAAGKLNKKIPLYNVCGNHDYKISEPASLEWYQVRFGNPWYRFEHKGNLFVVFESTMIKYGSEDWHIYKWQMQWLERTLLEAQNKNYDNITVYTHYPLALKKVDEPDEYANLPKTRRMKLLEMFHKYNVKAVFSGHFHHNTYVRDGELELITTNSSGIALSQMGEPEQPIGFRIVKMSPAGLVHKYYSYEDLPEKL
jgi:3',5'-cyclic AMP phosphodiesterase CpdA